MHLWTSSLRLALTEQKRLVQMTSRGPFQVQPFCAIATLLTCILLGYENSSWLLKQLLNPNCQCKCPLVPLQCSPHNTKMLLKDKKKPRAMNNWPLVWTWLMHNPVLYNAGCFDIGYILTGDQNEVTTSFHRSNGTGDTPLICLQR